MIDHSKGKDKVVQHTVYTDQVADNIVLCIDGNHHYKMSRREAWDLVHELAAMLTVR